MPTLHPITTARALSVAALLLYAVYAFASGAPGVGAVAVALAVFFGLPALREPMTTPGSGLSGAATVLLAFGSFVLCALLFEPLGVWAFCAFVLPVVGVAHWRYGLRGWQAPMLGIAFLLALATAIALVFLAVF